ncbi:MAG: hypothetical protein NT030_07920, partial [Candidatus Saganbacteria bacterium]|nr:hypothetical protein [Candidatus Saganbacteria bacterium]
MTDDEIAFAVHKYVVENYNYIPDAGDNWSPLGETIRRGGGDCEDLAFLEASLLQGALMRNGMSQGEAQNRVMGVAITDDNGGGHVYVTYVDSTGTQRYLESTGDSVGDAKSVYDLQDASKLNNHILFTFNDDSVNIVDKNYNYSTYETSWNPIGWVKDNIVDPVVDTGKAVVGYVEDNVIDPVVDTVKNVCVDAFKGFYNIFKGIFTGNLGEINDGFTDLGNIPWDALKGVGRLIKGAVQAVPDSITWIYDYFWGDVDLSKFDRTKEMDQHNTDYQNADMSYVYDFEIGEHDNGEDLLTDISRQKDNLLEGVDPEDFYYFDEHGMETIDEQRLEAYYDRAKAICMLQSAIVSILLTESEAKELVDEILNGSSDDEKRKNPLSDLISKSNQGLLQAVNTAIMNFFQEVEGYNYDRYNAMLEEVKKYKDGGGEEFLNVITFGGQDGKISNGNKKVTEWYLAAEERNMNALSAVLDSGEFQGINGYISSQINATLFNMDSYIEDAGNGRIKIDGDRLVGDLRDKLIGLLNMQALLVI